MGTTSGAVALHRRYWAAGAVSARKGLTIVPRQKAATSMDIFLLVTDNRNTRIWEVAPPHRGLSFSGPMVCRENTRLSRVPAIQID